MNPSEQTEAEDGKTLKHTVANVPPNITNHGVIGELNLRDYFAAAALAGMLANGDNIVSMDCRERVRYAYLNADTMLEHRTNPLD